MRTIKITYRAVFEQPTGKLNPMGVRLPGPQPVEVFIRSGKWYARELSTPARRVYEKLGNGFTLEMMTDTVKNSFARQVGPWQIWGIPPYNPHEKRAIDSVPRLFTANEICDLGDGTAGWYTAEDRTHILHAAAIPPGAHMPPAACGAAVPAKCFINNRANVEPSCPECAEVWRKEYKDR